MLNIAIEPPSVHSNVVNHWTLEQNGNSVKIVEWRDPTEVILFWNLDYGDSFTDLGFLGAHALALSALKAGAPTWR